MRLMRFLAGLAALSLTVPALPAAAAPRAAQPDITHRVIESFDGTPIYTTLFLPPDTDVAHPPPLILRSHGWAGHGERDMTEASSTTKALLDAGYGVLTWDERGFGYSGGQVHVLKPQLEGRDASALIDHVATTPDIAGRIACENERLPSGACADPVIGMAGRSYGGGIQMLTASFDSEFSTTTRGTEPRVDAIAPEITWNDLRYSLYDNEVLNLGWSEFLYAAGVPSAHGDGLAPTNPAGPQTGGLAEPVHRSQVEGTLTNRLSPQSTDFFARSSPATYLEGHPVTVPALFMQGSVDTLFDLSESARNFHAIRSHAPAKMIAFCGGHAVCPANYAEADDRAHLDQQIITWFDKYLRHDAVDTGAPVEYRTNESVWRSTDDFPPSDASSLTAAGNGQIISTPAPTTALPGSPDAASPPLIAAQPNAPGDPHAFTVPVATADEGSLELVGLPTANVRASGTGPEAHLFVKLVDRESGQVVNLQEAPLRVPSLSPDEQRFAVDMPGIAYTLPRGHHLDLQVSTSSAMHAGARVPAQLNVDVDVRVPVRR